MVSCNVTNIANMSKAQTIDLSGYISQAEYARLKDIPLNKLSQWIKRAKNNESIPPEAKDIEFIFVPELNMTLVKK